MTKPYIFSWSTRLLLLFALILAGTTTNAAVTASASSADGSNVAANVLDGSINTRWSGNGNGQWVKLNLGRTEQLTGIKIAFFKGDQRRTSFEIEVSTNNSSWTNVISRRQSSGNTKYNETFTFGQRSARYIRLVGFGNTNNSWTSITKMNVVKASGGSSSGSSSSGGNGNPSVPGRIQAEDYVGFSDTTSGNTGNAYRNDDVDIQSTSDSGGGYNVGWIASNEWLEYPINVTQLGEYRAEARVASQPGNSMFTIEVNGQTPGNAITVGGTGGWQNWVTKSTSLGQLSQGNTTLRVQVQAGNFNLNWLDIVRTSSGGGGSSSSSSSSSSGGGCTYLILHKY